MESIIKTLTLLGALALTVSGQTNEPCDGRIVNCIIDPCSVASCPAFSNAECVSSFCNECSAHFIVQGAKVSEVDCRGDSGISQSSGLSRLTASSGNSPILSRFGSRNSRNQGNSRSRGGSRSRNSPFLDMLFGSSGSSPRSSSGNPQSLPRIPGDIISRIMQWVPNEGNARSRMETFLNGLLTKVFSRLG